MALTATVYLVHFARPFKHARHYTGYTALESVDQRMARHRQGDGARLLRAVTLAGIDWRVVRVWEYPSIELARQKERSLKTHSAARNCPICCALVHRKPRP